MHQLVLGGTLIQSWHGMARHGTAPLLSSRNWGTKQYMTRQHLGFASATFPNPLSLPIFLILSLFLSLSLYSLYSLSLLHHLPSTFIFFIFFILFNFFFLLFISSLYVVCLLCFFASSIYYCHRILFSFLTEQLVVHCSLSLHLCLLKSYS